MRSVVFFTFLFGSAFTALFSPWLGMLSYLLVTHTGAVGFLWEGGETRFGMILGIGILVGYGLMELHKSFPPLRKFWVIGIFWTCILAASLFAFYPEWAMPRFWEYTRMFVMMLLLAGMINSPDRVAGACNTIAAALGFLGVHGTSVALRTRFQSEIQGPGSMIGDRNDYAMCLDMGVVFLWTLAAAQPTKKRRLLFRFASICCAIAVIATRSRGGFVGLVAAAFLLALFSRRKALGIVTLGIAAVAFVIITPQATMDRYRGISTAAEDDGSAIGRIQAWETSVKMIKARPLIGVGPRNFPLVFHDFSPNYPSRAPHNIFLAVGAEIGLPGMLAFTMIVFGSIIGMMRLRWRLGRALPDSPLRIHCTAIALTLMTYIVPGMFNNRQNFDLMYNVVAVGIGLSIVAQKEIAAAAAKKEESGAADEIEAELPQAATAAMTWQARPM